MATVRITNEIRSYVKNRFEALYRDRIERKMKELQNLDIGNVCYRHYIPAKYRELAQQLNADEDGPWLDTVSNVNVQMSYHHKNDPNLTEKFVFFKVPLNPPAPLPQRLRNVRFKLLESMAPYEHAKKIFLEADAMVEERDKLIHQIVDGVLTKCSTLRQVLELWPTALDFMPEEVKQKHATKTKRRQSVAEKVSIDDDVKVSLMKARMLATGG
jgi:hypothetical protein